LYDYGLAYFVSKTTPHFDKKNHFLSSMIRAGFHRPLRRWESILPLIIRPFSPSEPSSNYCKVERTLDIEKIRHNPTSPNVHSPSGCRRWLSSPSVSAEVVSTTYQDSFSQGITFLSPPKDVPLALKHYETFLLTILTRGKSSTGGAGEEGIQIKAAHSSAITWAELLEAISGNGSEDPLRIPMMNVLAVGPLLMQADVMYLKRVDELLQTTKQKVNLMNLANEAVSQKDNPVLTHREKHHLAALDLLLRHKRREALQTYLHILCMCPGDPLALSFAIDLASVLGDRESALRAATTVYSYCMDRQLVMPNFSVVASLMAVGMAAGGHFTAAENLILKISPQIDFDGCKALISWANSHAYDAEGRVAEGISALCNYDGVKYFEAAGLLFFDSKLYGYGTLFSLDRDGGSNPHPILRTYDEAFTRVLLYSGYAEGIPTKAFNLRVPNPLPRVMVKSFLDHLFVREVDPVLPNAPEVNVNANTVDRLTWLPPTPQLLTIATFVLVRITMHGYVLSSDSRWDQLQAAWLTLLQEYAGDYSSLPQSVQVAAALACHDIDELRFVNEGNPIVGARQLGSLMKLGKGEPCLETMHDEWKKVTNLLFNSNTNDFWVIDARPLFEIGLCYAALKTNKDLEALSQARSTCSRGVALRAASPEEWLRYSRVLEELGDIVAAEEAKSASLSMGHAESGNSTH
jgi:hypothetical protein